MNSAVYKSSELKVTGNFEEQNYVGDYATHNIYTGWSGEGTMTWAKKDSTVVGMMTEAYKTGEMPEIKNITKLTDKATGKAERAAVTDVVLTEFFLAKVEAKAMLEEEIPLNFSDYEVLETI